MSLPCLPAGSYSALGSGPQPFWHQGLVSWKRSSEQESMAPDSQERILFPRSCCFLWVKNAILGTAMAVQWLRLSASTAGVRSLDGKLRSCMPHSVVKKLKRKKGKKKALLSSLQTAKPSEQFFRGKENCDF